MTENREMTDEITKLHRHEVEDKPKDKFLKLRNILNVIFMLGAVIGLVLYFSFAHNVGIIIILAAMVFKFVECCFRFFH